MRIVHLLTRFLRAGSEENTLITCESQILDGNEVYIVHGGEFDAAYRNSVDERIKFIEISSLVHPISLINDAKAFMALRNLFYELKPLVVHTHQSKAGIVGRFAAYSSRVPVIIHGVHIVPFANAGGLARIVYLAAERLAARITDVFISVSEGVRHQYLTVGIGELKSHCVVHSGFDLKRFDLASLPEDWQYLLKIGQVKLRPPVLLMMAAFEPRKRHLEFLQAFPRVVTHFPNIRLLLAGEGKLRPEIEEQIARLNLTQNVILTGFRSDPERLIKLADLCLLASIREGLPRVVMQYLAGGRPVVASNLPGLDEVLEHAKNGIVLPTGDMEGVMDAIIQLIGDEAHLNRLSHGARYTDLSKWDAVYMGRRIKDVYGLVLQKKNISDSSQPIQNNN